MTTIIFKDDQGNTNEYKDVSPVMTLVAALTLDGHAEEADAILRVDWLMNEYLLTNDPLDTDAGVLASRLAILVREWTPKN